MKRTREMVSFFPSGSEERPEPVMPACSEPTWELVMDKKHFKLWRRPIEGNHLYQYRGNPTLAELLHCGSHGKPGTAARASQMLCLRWLWLPSLPVLSCSAPNQNHSMSLCSPCQPCLPLLRVPWCQLCLPLTLPYSLAYTFLSPFPTVFGTYTDVTPRQFFNVQVSVPRPYV